MLLLAAAACVPLGGCRTEPEAGLIELVEITGGGKGGQGGAGGEARPSSETPPTKLAPAVPPTADASARPRKTTSRNPARAAPKSRDDTAVPVAVAKPARNGPGLPATDARTERSESAVPAKLPSPVSTARMRPEGARAGLPTPGDVSPVSGGTAATLPLKTPGPKAGARTVSSIPLAGKADVTTAGKNGPVRLGLPGTDSSVPDSGRRAARIDLPANAEGGSRRPPGARVAIDAGTGAAGRGPRAGTTSIAVDAGAPPSDRPAPKVNRVAAPAEPAQPDSTGETRRLPEGVQGKDPRTGRPLPTPFRLVDLLPEAAKPTGGK